MYLILLILFTIKARKHLSVLAFISLSLNHWKMAQLTSSKSLTTEEILSPVTYGVLSSTKLAISSFSIMEKDRISGY